MFTFIFGVIMLLCIHGVQLLLSANALMWLVPGTVLAGTIFVALWDGRRKRIGIDHGCSDGGNQTNPA